MFPYYPIVVSSTNPGNFGMIKIPKPLNKNTKQNELKRIQYSMKIPLKTYLKRSPEFKYLDKKINLKKRTQTVRTMGNIVSNTG